MVNSKIPKWQFALLLCRSGSRQGDLKAQDGCKTRFMVSCKYVVNSTHMAPSILSFRHILTQMYAENRPNSSNSIRSATLGWQRILKIISEPGGKSCSIMSSQHLSSSPKLLAYSAIVEDVRRGGRVWRHMILVILAFFPKLRHTSSRNLDNLWPSLTPKISHCVIE